MSDRRPGSVVRYGPDTAQFVETTVPGGAPRGTAVLIHGGYWRERYGLDLMDPMVEHLVAGGWAVVNLEYRRLTGGPGDPPPADPGPGIWPELSADIALGIEAGLDAVGRHRPVVAIGHSAGGQLALWAAGRSSGTSGIDAVVALAPVADLVEADRRALSRGVVRRLLGGTATEVPERYRAASPMALLPLGAALLVVHGSIDDAVPIELSQALAESARSAGDDVAGVFPGDVDHFHVIDPAHPVWRPIDRWLIALAEAPLGDG